jgi:protease-4
MAMAMSWILTRRLRRHSARTRSCLRIFRRSTLSIGACRPRIGVVVVDGDMVDGDNVDIPLVDIHLSGGRTVSQAIQGFTEDPTVRAIVVRVDSPGGSAMAADQIWRAIRRARQVKPVIASLGSVAASGGYYVASATDEIWADPSTVTGSIGVFFGKVDIAPLAERIGIGIEVLSRGKHADMESIWRPFTDDERAVLKQKVHSGIRCSCSE